MRPFALFCLLALGLALPALGQATSDRPADGLLDAPMLQAIVDLQVARDGAVLTELLGNEKPAVRARAAFALASVQDSLATPALLALLDDEAATVRADAAFALGQMPGHVSPEALLDAFFDEADAAVQRRLLEALGKKGDAASLGRLAEHAWNEALRADGALAVARYALRGIHAPEAIDFLVTSLNARVPEERLHAAYYFGRSRETEAWQPHADTLRALLDTLAPDEPAAMYLVAGLARLDDEADTPRLRAWAATAEDWRTRVNAVRALARRTDTIGIRAALYDRLVDPSVHVAIAAAEALDDGKRWSATDIDLITKWLRHNSYAWRITTPLLRGLARQPESVSTVLNELERRRGAPPLLAYADGLSALTELPHEEAFDRLVNAAHHPDLAVAMAGLRTLVARWREVREQPVATKAYFTVFAEALHRGDAGLTFFSAPLLTDSLFTAYDPATTLLTAYDALDAPADLDAMTTILRALGDVADAPPEADSLLRHTLESDHRRLVSAAAAALEQRTGETIELPDDPAPAEQEIDWAYLRTLGPHPRLVLDTEKGAVTLVLDAEQAPLTVQTIARFAQDGRYDGVPFHRVIPNFVVQGGDFERGDGFGGPPFSIRSEFTRLPYGAGTLGMASSGKDTEGSQFFITHSMQPHLDGRYTAFGTVIKGQDVVDTLYAHDRILQATIQPETR